MKFKATLLWVKPESNPEESIQEYEAESLEAAKAEAQKLIAGDLPGLGWRSYKDDELWGKEQRRVITVEAVA